MVMLAEIWKPIAGYEGLYEVSDLGRVRSFHKCEEGRILKTSKNNNGYLRVALSKHGNTRFYAVHRLVAEAFLFKPEGKDTVNHIDFDITNNQIENLQWCTQKENIAYSAKHRRFENAGANNKPVIQTEIHGKFENRFKSICEAARMTCIRQSSISACCNGRCKTAGGYLWRFQ